MYKKSEFEKEMDAARSKEHGEYHRNAFRYIPCVLAMYGILFREMNFNGIKGAALVLVFYLAIEAIYGLLKKDTWIFTISSWAVWAWFYYAWVVEDLDVWSSIAAPLGILLVLGRILSYWSIYQEKRYRPEN